MSARRSALASPSTAAGRTGHLSRKTQRRASSGLLKTSDAGAGK